MATTTQQHAKQGEFTINTQTHGYPDGPAHALVEVSPIDRESYMAILAAGVDGRFSFDFAVRADAIEIERAYIEGMRADVDALPEWVVLICERLEAAIGVAA